SDATPGTAAWTLTLWSNSVAVAEYAGLGLALSRTFQLWSEQWQCPLARLQAIEETLRSEGTASCRGGDYDRWDLEVRGGVLGAVRLLATPEERGAGRQLVRFRLWPMC